MSSKNTKSIDIPPELAEKIKAKAKDQLRSFSAQVVFDLQEAYAEKSDG